MTNFQSYTPEVGMGGARYGRLYAEKVLWKYRQLVCQDSYRISRFTDREMSLRTMQRYHSERVLPEGSPFDDVDDCNSITRIRHG